MRVRLGSQGRLVGIGAESGEPLNRLATTHDAPLLGRIHAIWALGQLAEHDPPRFDAIAQLCSDADAEVRAQAARTLAYASRDNDQRRAACGNALAPLLADTSPRVRCLAAIALGKLRHPAPLAELLQMAAKDGEDPTLRHAVSMALAGGHTSEELVKAATGASDLQRLILVVALGKQKSPLVADFLADANERVALEAARVIWDAPIPAANDRLAGIIGKTKSTSDPLLRRVLAANVAGRTPRNLQAVINLACRSDIDPKLRDLAWEQVHTWAKTSPRDSVNGDWRPLEPRPVEEVVATLRHSLPKLVEVSSSNPAGLIVAAELGVDEAFAPMMSIVTNEAQPEQMRIRAIAAYGKANENVTHQAIDAGLKSTNAGVRTAALKLWSNRFPTQVVERLRDTLNTGTMPERQAAMDMLAGLASPAAREVVGHWMERLESGKCPPELQIEVLEAAGKSTDAKLVERKKRFTEQLASASPVDQHANCLSGGDAQRGQKIFETNDTLACRRCHSVKPGEVLVGPCLASVGVERKPAEILESIVTPNAKICEGFETAVLELDSGKVVTGIVRHEDKSKIELVDAEAKTIVIDPASVENRVKGKSAMPDNVMEHMTPRDLRDLVAYLSQLKAALPNTAAQSQKK